MRTALVNGRIPLGERIVTGQTVLLDDGRIEAAPGDGICCMDAARVDLEGQRIRCRASSMCRRQWRRRYYSTTIRSLESIGAIGTARQFGTTGFLPTLISDDLDTIAQAIAAVHPARRAAARRPRHSHRNEGPFLNWTRRGVHDPKTVGWITA